ncbi:MAG: Arginine decarboxylase [Syntrophomonadaceae bacterium]|nr:Arginine decarboxylase [Bacillota bacterium]
MDQTRLPIWEQVKKYQQKDRVWLHFPGHGGGLGLPVGEATAAFAEVARLDLTELPELDDLHNPTGAIAEAQELAADVWHADNTYFLVNGSSAGVLAMVLATCSPGELILAPRNAHSSFYHALALSGAVPRYLTVAEQNGLPLNVTSKAVKEAFARYPQARAFFLTSPGYYGICADVAEIAAIVRSHGALLLLDEAHGAHLGFSRSLPDSAGHLADLRVQSWHKTLAALTPGAVLHQHGVGVDQHRLRSALQLVQTSSPSYPLLLSLDAVRREMALNGETVAGEMAKKASELRFAVAKLLPVLTETELAPTDFRLDTTRVTILTRQAGICSFTAARRLAQLGIDLELVHAGALLAVVGPGFQVKNVKRVVTALSSLRQQKPKKSRALPALPQADVVLSPREAFYCASRYVALQDARGQIAAATVASYPPGMPLVAPGERVTDDVVTYLQLARRAGVSFRGLDGEERIKICGAEK